MKSTFIAVSIIYLSQSFHQIEYSLEQQQYRNNIFQMILSTFHLFSQINSGMSQAIQELDKPKLRNIFTVHNQELILTLTDNHLFLHPHSQQKTPTHLCQLTFEVKFEVLYQPLTNDPSPGIPIAFKLERQSCTEQLTFISNNPALVEIWSLQLEKKINQRNFHKLFKAKKKIGKGAFATVYLAERLRDHKMVAVKAFSKEKQYSGDKGKQSLQNEIKLMRQISHDNIMKLEGVYETDNSIYAILQYLQGEQLNQVLKNNKKMEPYQIKEIIQNILRALSYLSKLRIIHRDLKPENIMFRKQKSCDLALCDFGLATHADEEKYLFVRCGTPGFVAPQIINIRDMSTKSQPISDIFSAGIIFHYLLFGFSVFEGKKYNDILAQNRSCQLTFSKDFYSKINSKALDLLKMMLQKDPSKRISAQQALSHPYFTGEMDIQYEEKGYFKDLTNCSSAYRLKKTYQTPSITSKKGDSKLSFFDSIRKENGRSLFH